MEQKSNRVLVQVVATSEEVPIVDKVFKEADSLSEKIIATSTTTHDSFILSYKVDPESLSFIALSNDWLYQRLRMFPPIQMKELYRKA